MTLLLVFMMVFTMMPQMAWADSGTETVNIYTTASDLQFQDADGVSMAVSSTVEGAYKKYILSDIEPGLYTYTSRQYGTGKLRINNSEDIYLRAVEFTFKEGGSRFHMTVTHPTDEELIYTSPSTDGLTAEILVPVLGWGTTYQFDFCPEEAGWCSFFGSLWVTEGTSTLQGFKQRGYNLSDGGAYVMGNETNVSIRVPEGANLRVRSLIMFYREPIDYHIEFLKTEDGYDYYTAKVPNRLYGSLYYTVSKEGCVTTSKIFSSSEKEITVTDAQIQGDPQTQVKQSFEASIISNGNRAKFIQLQP